MNMNYLTDENLNLVGFTMIGCTNTSGLGDKRLGQGFVISGGSAFVAELDKPSTSDIAALLGDDYNPDEWLHYRSRSA